MQTNTNRRRLFSSRSQLFFVVLFLINATLSAVPAFRKPVVLKQPNGALLTVLLHGDEHFNYRTTSDGYLIAENAQGYYQYAQIDAAGEIRSLNTVANDVATRKASETALLKTIQPVTEGEMLAIKVHSGKRAQKAPSANGPLRTMPLSGSPHSLVILVNFSDKSYSVTNPQTAYTNLLNQKGYAANNGTGSAKDYFRENSNGQFNPQFDVVGPYTLPNNMAFYGANTSGSDDNPRQMVIDACKLADAAGVDFAQYDTDNDGYVDNIFVYYAGYNEAEGASANTIWPHRWSLGSTSTKLDGKIIYDYACTSELKGTSGTTMCGVGTFVHEFGHVLGLPDFYATNSATHHTLYSWDVMDYGPYNNNGRTPPNYSSYEKFFLGWLTPVELKTPQNVTLDTLTHSNKAYLLSKTGAHNLDGENPSPTEFFLLENRQKKGWDAFLPGHGLLVTRVYYSASAWNNNSVNNSSTAMGVDIMEADGTATDASCSGDGFPGTSKVVSYTPVLRDGTDIIRPLTNITETNGIISFQLMGGEFPETNAPVAVAASNIRQTSFTANWNAVKFADKYLLDVYTVNGTDTSYISGLKLKDVGTITSYDITGLSVEQQYYYRLKAVSGTVVTIYSNIIPVKTIAYTFDMFAPVALPATDVDRTNFTAHWNALPGATAYLVNVFTKVAGTQLTDSVYGFSLFPAGWSKNFTLTYTSSTMYGQASPSLRMSYNSDYLQTAIFSNKLSAAQFWCRGSGLLGTNSLLIYGSEDGVSWTVIKTVQSLQNTSQTVKITEAELGASKALKIEFSKPGSGSLAIDDLKLSFYAVVNKYVAGLEAFSVGNVLSYAFSNLLPSTSYYYTVVALNNQQKSALSNEIQLTTTQDAVSEVQNIADKHFSVHVVDHTIIIDTQQLLGQKLTVHTVNGQRCYESQISNSHTQFDCSGWAHGVYVVRIGQAVYKVLL